MNYLKTSHWSHKSKFNILIRSDHWLLRYSTFNILRSSSVGCDLHLNSLKSSLWSYKHEF